MMKPTKSVVTIDYRETNPILLRAFENHPFLLPRFGYLNTGDYQIEKLILVERKTCIDFSLSVIQGRLFRQAIRLSQAVRDGTVTTAVLIVEGSKDEFQKLHISQEAILGAMASVQVKFQLPLFRTLTPLETVKLIEIIYLQIVEEDETYNRSFPVRWGKTNKLIRRKNQIHLLQGLPGIGPSRAVNLLDHFGSVGGVFAVSAEELSFIQGIGKTTALKIRQILDP